MKDLLPLALNSILILVEVFALYQLGCCFFDRKVTGERFVLCILGLVVTNIACLILAGGILILKVIVLIAVDAFWLKLIFRAHFLKCLTVGAFFISLMTLTDSAFLVGMELLFGMGAHEILGGVYSCYALGCIVKIIELFFIVVLKTQVRRHLSFRKANRWDWLRVIIFPASSAVVGLTLLQIYITVEAAAPQILFCATVLLFADVLAIVLLNYLEKQQQKVQDYSILQQSVRMKHDNVLGWMNAYTNQRKQNHEYRNQLEVIRGLARLPDCSERIIAYVNDLLQTDMTDSLLMNTGRPVVDIVLNQKYTIAQSREITMHVQLDDLREFALPDDALVVVLSNLLDNAIEACEQIADPAERIIRLNMSADPEANFLYIENTTASPVKITENQIPTTKKDAAAHGYGLKNVAALLERNHAEFAMDYDEVRHMFCFSAQIIP